MTTGPRHGRQLLQTERPLGSRVHSFLLHVSCGCLPVCLLYQTRWSGAVFWILCLSIPRHRPHSHGGSKRELTPRGTKDTPRPAVWISSRSDAHTRLCKCSLAALSSRLRKAGLPLLPCAIYNLLWQGAGCSSTALSH